MKTCPKCGRTVFVDPKTGCLMAHGPESIDGPYDVCSGTGMEVEPQTPDQAESR